MYIVMYILVQIEPYKIVDFMKEHKEDMDKVRVQLQLHKIIWDPNKREV